MKQKSAGKVPQRLAKVLCVLKLDECSSFQFCLSIPERECVCVRERNLSSNRDTSEEPRH